MSTAAAACGSSSRSTSVIRCVVDQVGEPVAAQQQPVAHRGRRADQVDVRAGSDSGSPSSERSTTLRHGCAAARLRGELTGRPIRSWT